jgi:hypothetical protein
VRPDTTNDSSWKQAAFFVLQTELSPSLLIHSSGRHLNLFSDLKNYGLGGPSFIAWSTREGPRSFARDAELDVTKMEENWVLAWFASSEGWTNWDSPWAIFLQHKPSSMRLDSAGLHLSFPERAGDVVLMPLYGYYKPPLEGRDFLAEHRLPSRQIKTWQWAKGLPREPLTRVRYWAGATREIPIYCEDSFSVDRGRDSITIRSRFDYYSIHDDWNTKPLRLAPISPTLGLALNLGGFPVQLSGKHFDFDLPTPFGPYTAIQDTDSFDATFPVLQYVNETEAVEAAGTSTNHSAQLALNRLQELARAKFMNPDALACDRISLTNGRAIHDLEWYATALPYYHEATRSNAIGSLQEVVRQEFLSTNRVAPIGRSDAGCGASVLQGLWAYAQFTGDWDLIRTRWPVVKELFTTPAEARWASFGCHGIGEISEEAAPCLAFARLAYRVGDLDSYHYGCYLFARELVHLFLKQHGADYFRKQQPWHSLEFMNEDVFLTRVQDEPAGWQIDGPDFPSAAGERQFLNRWDQFSSADVGRFYQDFLQENVRSELNWWRNRQELQRRPAHTAHVMPSLLQLESLLLNQAPGEISNAAPDAFSGSPSDVIANCVSVLRLNRTRRYERLIPGGDASPLVAGLEREIAGPNTTLVTDIKLPAANQSKTAGASWPQPIWPAWKTPTSASWSFGQVKPVRATEPDRVRIVPLNWNTQVILYE